MKHYILKLAQVGILAAIALVPAANAAVVFSDTFDGALTPLGDKLTSGDTWARSRPLGGRLSQTSAEVGNGVLRVETDAKPYGGAVVAEKRAEFDFFTNEITITLTGINIESPGNGRLSAQGLRLAIGSYLIFRSVNNWSRYSNFGIGVYGSGRFLFSGYNATIGPLVAVPLQNIPSPFLNFNVSQITALKLTLNATHYRLAFEFGNQLNALSFAGLHGLKKDLWRVSGDGEGGMRRLTFNKTKAATDLADAQDTNIGVADAQAAYDAAVAAYDIQWAIEEPTAGYSHIFFGAVSEDGEGAAVTLDSITVETTNILDVLAVP